MLVLVLLPMLVMFKPPRHIGAATKKLRSSTQTLDF
jgi:hypothetical protein